MPSATAGIDLKGRHSIHFYRLLFPLAVAVLYFTLWGMAPQRTWLAMRNGFAILYAVLPSLCMVFVLMAVLNLFLKPLHFAEALRKGTKIRQMSVAAVAGILSAGPIYAWYPMLKDLREKGADFSLIAVFLVNRAVKPFLLPMLVSFFGWSYTLMLTLLTVAGSFGVGFLVWAFLDSGNRPTRD
ncbi:MAG: hypothetical protein JXL20_05900 [Deltaproteobacteria bacterium]|nr:hypothetical protein [Deltaproteobacteria bacterium]